MNLITVENITKGFDNVLFKNISFKINDGDKIGLIGPNGRGKTTLLKCLMKELSVNEGNIIYRGNISIKYLSQEHEFDEELSVIEYLLSSQKNILDIIKEYEEMSNALSENYENEAFKKRYDHLLDTMNKKDIWAVESKVRGVLNTLNLNFSDKIKILSGGQRRRLKIAEAIIDESDLLILDEPTNHIDSEAIEYLEELLIKREKALLMVTHDRYFLNKIANKIFELNKNLDIYHGNYSYYLEERAQRMIDEESKQRKLKSLYKSELDWISRGCRARTTKQKFRVNRFSEIKDKMKTSSSKEMMIDISQSRLGKKIISIDHISKSYDKKLIDDFSYKILRDDRIGIIGSNGAGKSTLFKMIAGEIMPDTGSIDMGTTLKLGYYSQEDIRFKEDMVVDEYFEDMVIDHKIFEMFLFDYKKRKQEIKRLSGGEKRRLYLLKILIQKPNILLMDEPTNDLDIETLSILEDYISVFNGPALIVSHDRYFLDRTCEKLFVFKEGKVEVFYGNYSDYKRSKQEIKQEVKKEVKKEINKKALTYKEELEYKDLEKNIDEINQKIEDIEKEMESYSSDFTKLHSLMKEKEELDNLLNEKEERWLELTEKMEEYE